MEQVNGLPGFRLSRLPSGGCHFGVLCNEALESEAWQPLSWPSVLVFCLQGTFPNELLPTSPLRHLSILQPHPLFLQGLIRPHKVVARAEPGRPQEEEGWGGIVTWRQSCPPLAECGRFVPVWPTGLSGNVCFALFVLVASFAGSVNESGAPAAPSGAADGSRLFGLDLAVILAPPCPVLLSAGVVAGL